jgi:hypothetical protein
VVAWCSASGVGTQCATPAVALCAGGTQVGRVHDVATFDAWDDVVYLGGVVGTTWGTDLAEASVTFDDGFG